MGIVWYGRYSVYFEEAQAELGRRCGLGYRDFYEASLRAPIVEFHIDYYQPIYLDEEFTVRAALIWSEGAKLYMEYTIIKKDASIATRAYTIQLFIDSNNSEPCLIAPEMLENLRRRWKKGEFKSLR
jgi:acyl-CoA thioester hydrolase